MPVRVRDQRRLLVIALSLLLCTVIVFANATTTIAQTVREDDRQSIIDETTFYDIVPLGDCGAGAGGKFALTGDNPKDAFNYFLTKGLESVQVAGIIGNLMQESGVNPKSNQANGPGRGIAQWSEGGRWDQLVKWAGARDPEALDTQLDFMWYEMTEVKPWSDTLPALKLTTSIDNIYPKNDPGLGVQSYGSAYIFEMKYEKADPNAVNMPNRIKQAQIALDKYGKTSGGCGGITVDGYAFPVAPQTQINYTNLPCKAGTRRYTDTYGTSSTIKTCHHDGSPAFDLMYKDVDNKPIYAITKGTIIKVNKAYANDSGASGMRCNSIQFHSTNGTDDSFYWYGHILADPGIEAGKDVEAGTRLGVVAPRPYGPKCWGGGPHLHIDRGCHDKNNQFKQGGSPSCRDPAFLDDLQKIYDRLRKSLIVRKSGRLSPVTAMTSTRSSQARASWRLE
jgi:hypothetical protein